MSRSDRADDQAPIVGKFDADWYRATFHDVEILGMDPTRHFRRYGVLMGRAPNADLARDPTGQAKPPSKPPALKPRATAAPASVDLDLPAPRRGRELVAAHEIALAGDHDQAIDYARRYLPAEYAHTLHVLEANKAVAEGSESRWLDHLNTYLKHFNVAPVELKSTGHDNVLSRIMTAALPPITDGPLVSVIMAAWNAEKTIEYAIRSILNQTWQNLELLIVDDASEDGTWGVIQRLAASDSRIRTFRNSVNVGPYVSKNIAATQARGEWITGHDADDWAHPERLQQQVTFCRKRNIPVSMSGMLRMAEDGQFVQLKRIRGLAYDGACRGALISLMIHSQLFHDLLGFWDSVRVGGDAELLSRIEHIRQKTTPMLTKVTMLCLNNPEGLMNHLGLENSKVTGKSPHRQAYRDNYRSFHRGLNKYSSRMEFPVQKRPFPAPTEVISDFEQSKKVIDDYAKQGLLLRQDVDVDIVLITNLRFPGGNASSSMDEIRFFLNAGCSISIIHCPLDQSMGRPVSDRYDAWQDKIVNWSRVSSISAKVLICRHPRVVLSSAFKKIQPLIRANTAFVVVNNSWKRPSGEKVYDRRELFLAAQQIKSEKITFCPIGPEIRAELQEEAKSSGVNVTLSEVDWTPTFDLAQYEHAPKSRMKTPYRIGRHGRDGPEKWREIPSELQSAFPDSDDFTINILGGAKVAEKILTRLPGNWKVYEFGEVAPGDYLRDLDVFIYFPNTGLVEAFGRTIVEAMLAARPVLLPRSFEATFDDLPIYLEPAQVANAVRALAKDNAGRIAYLREVQQIADARYSSPVIARRLMGTGLNLPGADLNVPRLSEAALRFKQRIEAVVS